MSNGISPLLPFFGECIFFKTRCSCVHFVQVGTNTLLSISQVNLLSLFKKKSLSD